MQNGLYAYAPHFGKIAYVVSIVRKLSKLIAHAVSARFLRRRWAPHRCRLSLPAHGILSDARQSHRRLATTIITDYGHNPDAIQALVDAVGNMPAPPESRRTVVISGAGDRRDEDIRKQTEILGDAFDRVVLYQDACQRGRADGEVLALLRDGLKNARHTREVEEIHGEFLAINTALDKLQPGDICLILIDQVDESLAHIAKCVAEQ